MSTRSKASSLAGGLERLARALRALSLLDDRRDVAEHVCDAQAADVLREVAPVRADVAERGRRPALVRLEPPRVVGVLEQPVLEVLADEELRPADVAARDREAGLLDERVPAVVEGHCMNDARLGRLVEQRARLGRGHRERLVGDDVFAAGERRGIHRIVQVVRRGVVDDLDGWVIQQRLVTAVRPLDAERVRLLLRGGVAAAGDRHDVDVPEPADRVDMMRPDESGADDSHSDTFHCVLLSLPLNPRRVASAFRRKIGARICLPPDQPPPRLRRSAVALRAKAEGGSHEIPFHAIRSRRKSTPTTSPATPGGTAARSPRAHPGWRRAAARWRRPGRCSSLCW